MARHERATEKPAPARIPLVGPQYLTTEELATVLNQTVRAIRHWRTIEYGPKSTKMGRSVRYLKREVEEYCADPEGYQCRRSLEIA